MMQGKVHTLSSLKSCDIDRMYELMTEFYDNVKKEVFLKDLHEKQYVVLLRDTQAHIQGFSTLKIIPIPLHSSEKEVMGIFSGDTIIHKKYWGSIEGLKTTIGLYFELAKDYDKLYWFLIVKGYKTYKILPTFFKEFYPNYRAETPRQIQEIIASFGETYYPQEYNKEKGVIEYKGVKDSLKKGVADITTRKRQDKDIDFFLKNNPEYFKGHDMVCVALIKEDNLLERAKKRLLDSATMKGE